MWVVVAIWLVVAMWAFAATWADGRGDPVRTSDLAGTLGALDQMRELEGPSRFLGVLIHGQGRGRLSVEDDQNARLAAKQNNAKATESAAASQ